MNEPVLDILDRLIRFDTLSANSNLPLIAYVQDFLDQRGFVTHRLPDPTGTKAGLFAQIGPAGGGIALSAHSDVVPVAGQSWTVDPFQLTRKGDRLFGRGSCDMKGYLAAMLACADRAAGLNLAAPLKLVLSYDEEIGCVGIQQMKDQLAPLIGHPRACFVGEPTGMRVAIGHKGKAAYHARFTGAQGHSAMAPRFVNALHLALDFGQALRDLQDDYAAHGARDAAYDIAHGTVHMGRLAGGGALNMIPETAVMEYEFRHLSGDPLARFEARLDAAAAEIAARYQPLYAGARIDLDRVNAYPGLDVAPDHPVVALAQDLTRSQGVVKVSFGTEAGVFADLGIPTVVCGPGSMAGQGHKPDEYLELDQLRACETMLDGVLHSLQA